MSEETAPAVNYYGQVPLWNRLSYRRRRTVKRAVLYLMLVVVLFVVLFPLFWMFSTALRPRDEMFVRGVQLLPSQFTLDHYETILFDSAFPTYFYNSVVVSTGVVVITTTLSTLGGYGLARIDIPKKLIFARGILFGYMFPAILLAIPMFIFWRQIGIINSLFGLILAETALALPFSLWLMWKFFQTVPYSLEESAMMAGATRFQAFVDIALPMAKPGMIAVAIFAYAVSWNEFTMPTVLISDNTKWVLTVGIFSFTQQNSVLWGQILAASSLISLPGFVFVYFLQKYLLRGFRTGDIG